MKHTPSGLKYDDQEYDALLKEFTDRVESLKCFFRKMELIHEQVRL